jgi:short-subunit dehydrogenase
MVLLLSKLNRTHHLHIKNLGANVTIVSRSQEKLDVAVKQLRGFSSREKYLKYIIFVLGL